MKCRKATEEDLIQLAELRWDFRMEGGDERPAVSKPEFIEACVSFLQHGLKSGYHAYWIAEQNGEIISQVFVHKIDMVPRPCKIRDQFGYVTNNYTKPAHRNKGIGSRLIKRVREWARNEDMELLLVYPSEEAVSFYERAGFCAENEAMKLQLRPYYSPGWSEGETPVT